MAGFAVDQSSPLNTAPPLAGAAQQPVPFFDAAQRSADEAFNVDRPGARGLALQTELWKRHQAIEAAAGISLQPSDTMAEASPAPTDTQGPAELMVGRIVRGVGRLVHAGPSDADYEAKVEELRAQNPAAFANIPTREAVTARLQSTWNAKAQAVAEAQGTTTGKVGGFVGGMVGAMGDEANIGGLLLGGAGAARPLALRMLSQAAINAGITTVEAPARMDQAKTYGGPAYTAQQAAADIGMAAAGGAAFEGLGTAAHAVVRPIIRHFEAPKPDLSAVSAGVSADLPAASAATPDPATKRAAQVAGAALRDDQAIGARAGSDHAAATASLDAHAPPPLSPDRDLAQILPDAGGDGALTATDYRGRTIYGGSFDPRTLAADPVRFQYKEGGDAAGVTARLKGVEAWDATASGKVIVYEDRSGAQFIADGHQRLGLANRMEGQGFDARLDGYLFREADGWTPGEVRTVAALKNIREGAGSPLDAAKVLREAPDAIHDRSLPVSGEFMGQARGLALLSDPAFRAVVNHVIPERYGAEVGLMASTRPDLHEAIVRLLHQAEPANADEARALVVEALQDDWIRHDGDQADLFGYDPSMSAMIARAKIAASVKRSLASDARLFSGLVRHADAIEAGGNALARDANEARLAVDRAALEVTAKLALRAGPVGEAMQAAVVRVHAGEAPGVAAKAVLARVREAIEAGERLDDARGVSLDPQPPSAHAEQLLEPFGEVGGPGAQAQEKMAPEDAGLSEAHPGLFGDLAPVDRFEKAHEALSACAPAGE